MPRACTVCTHARLAEVDSALLRGVPRLRVARTFGLREPAVRRHAKRHLPEHQELARHANEVVAADKLMERVRRTVTRLESLLDSVEASKDPRTTILVARELRSWVELLNGTSGNGSPGPQSARASGDPHALAREAREYLSWYERQVAASRASGEKSSWSPANRLHSDVAIIELD